MTLLKRRLPQCVYNRCITLLYGTVDEINVALKRDCPDEFVPLLECCQGHWKCYSHDGYEADYICVTRNKSRDTELAALAHEALHLVSHALRMAGIQHTWETEEAYTYYQQWVIRECQRALAKART